MVRLEHWEWGGETKLQNQNHSEQGKCHTGIRVLLSYNGGVTSSQAYFRAVTLAAM